MPDIFKFWSVLKKGHHIHPSDASVFARMDAARHGFELGCLPSSYGGRLRTAKVVMLYLSPGFSQHDLDDAASAEGRAHHLRKLKGNEPFRSDTPGAKWLQERTRRFCDFETVREHFAVLNIGAYHSKNLKHYGAMLALPSSRATLDWAQNALFPSAERKERFVICMRSAAHWGLEAGADYKGFLFAPKVTREGHMLRTAENDRLVRMVQRHLKT